MSDSDADHRAAPISDARGVPHWGGARPVVHSCGTGLATAVTNDVLERLARAGGPSARGWWIHPTRPVRPPGILRRHSTRVTRSAAIRSSILERSTLAHSTSEAPTDKGARSQISGSS